MKVGKRKRREEEVVTGEEVELTRVNLEMGGDV